MSDNIFLSRSNGEASLDELAGRVRASCRAADQAWSNALGHVLDAGDALNEAQSRVTTNWKRWLHENCFPLGVSTAQLYQRLARHREEIEVEYRHVGWLSLRAAVRLISEPKPAAKASKPEKPIVPEWLVAWNKAPAEEKTAGLATIKLAAFLGVIPDTWRAELERRMRGLDTDAGDPNTKLTAAFRAAMSHLASADDPKTSKTVAQSQEVAALNALRGIARVYADFHDLTVGVRSFEKPRRRRAA